MKKPLSEMTLKELWQLFPIILVAHRDDWAEWFREEAAALGPLLPPGTCIHHIGSTAIRGIWAKPIVDILAELPAGIEPPGVKGALLSHGWLCMNEREGRISFNKGYTEDGFAERVFHLHVRRAGDADEIAFRDYLNARPAVANEYERLKLSLWKPFEHDRDGYTAAKSDFVRKATALAQQPDGARGGTDAPGGTATEGKAE